MNGRKGRTVIPRPARQVNYCRGRDDQPGYHCPSATPLPEAIALMDKHHVNSLVVMENSMISGIIKRDDIIKEVAK